MALMAGWQGYRHFLSVVAKNQRGLLFRDPPTHTHTLTRLSAKEFIRCSFTFAISHQSRQCVDVACDKVNLARSRVLELGTEVRGATLHVDAFGD